MDDIEYTGPTKEQLDMMSGRLKQPDIMFIGWNIAPDEKETDE